MTCLDVGCGSGDVTMELARLAGKRGKAIGTDLDPTKIELARQEAQALGISSFEFRVADIRETQGVPGFDAVYARFLLAHLSDPVQTVDTFYQLVKPGGLVILEDIDFSGYLVYPESPAFGRYHQLYCAVVRKRGGDPNIGPRLPLLLCAQGFTNVEMALTQPMAMQGEIKLLNPVTMQNIADAVVNEKLATREEVADLVRELYVRRRSNDACRSAASGSGVGTASV